MAQPAVDGGLFGLLASLPNPQLIMQELQRLNANLEGLTPAINIMAQNASSIKDLADGLKNFKPEDMTKMVQSLDRASASGEAIYKQLWGKK